MSTTADDLSSRAEPPDHGDADLLGRWQQAGEGLKTDLSAKPTDDGLDTPTPEEPHRRRWALPRPTKAGVLRRLPVAVLVIALIAAGVVLVNVQRTDSARSSALQAARTDARLVGTFRYQHINQDLQAVEHRSTPAFSKQYLQAQSDLTQLLTQYKANSVATVLDVAIQTVSSHKAVALVFVDQAVTNTAVGSQPKVEPSRMKMTLVRSGGRWLISNVQIVS